MISLFVQIRKEKRDPLSTISVSSALAPARGSDPLTPKKSEIRTLPNIWVVSPCSCPSTEKKGQRGPHSSQLTEVSIPKLSLPQFLSLRPSASPGFRFGKKKVCDRRLLTRQHREKKKKQGPKEVKGPRANGSKGQGVSWAKGSKGQTVQRPKGPRAKGSKGQRVQGHGHGNTNGRSKDKKEERHP